MFNIVALSRMRALIVGVSATFADESLEASNLFKQLTMSDFVPSGNLPIFESDGGHAGFHVKRIHRSLRHVSSKICTIWSSVNNHFGR